MLRRILAVIAGSVVAMAVISLVEPIGHRAISATAKCGF